MRPIRSILARLAWPTPCRRDRPWPSPGGRGQSSSTSCCRTARVGLGDGLPARTSCSLGFVLVFRVKYLAIAVEEVHRVLDRGQIARGLSVFSGRLGAGVHFLAVLPVRSLGLASVAVGGQLLGTDAGVLVPQLQVGGKGVDQLHPFAGPASCRDRTPTSSIGCFFCALCHGGLPTPPPPLSTPVENCGISRDTSLGTQNRIQRKTCGRCASSCRSSGVTIPYPELHSAMQHIAVSECL